MKKYYNLQFKFKHITYDLSVWRESYYQIDFIKWEKTRKKFSNILFPIRDILEEDFTNYEI